MPRPSCLNAPGILGGVALGVREDLLRIAGEVGDGDPEVEVVQGVLLHQLQVLRVLGDKPGQHGGCSHAHTHRVSATCAVCGRAGCKSGQSQPCRAWHEALPGAEAAGALPLPAETWILSAGS